MNYKEIAKTHSVDGTVILSEDGKEILYVSESLASFLGYSCDEMYDVLKTNEVGSCFEDKRRHMMNIVNQLKSYGQYSISYKVVLKNGINTEVYEYGHIIEHEGIKYIHISIVKKNTLVEDDNVVDARYIDSLTKLKNRQYFEECIDGFVENSTKTYGFIMIDMDNFKGINDNFGHREGDDVLIRAARLIDDNKLDGMVVGRYGGDEFLVFLPIVESITEVEEFCNRVHELFKKEFFTFNKYSSLALSIGAVISDEKLSYIELLKRVDIALYNAKAAGKDRTVFYNDQMSFLSSNTSRDERSNSLYYNIMGKMADDLLKIFSKDNGDMNVLYDAISYLGNRFEVDKILVLEKSIDGKYIYFSDQWDTELGHKSTPGYQEKLPTDAFYMPPFKDGYGFIEDASKVENPIDAARLMKFGIKQLLNVEVYQGEEVIGYLGYDVCSDYKLTQVEIQALVAASQIIGEHLRLRRNKLHHTLERKVIETLFNTINQPVILVDKITFEVEYFNESAKSVEETLEMGKSIAEVLKMPENEVKEHFSKRTPILYKNDKYRIDVIGWELSKWSYIVYRL